MFSRFIKLSILTLTFGLPVTVFSQIVAGFNVSTSKGCIPLSVTFKNISTENGLPIDQNKYIFKWDMDEGQYSENIPDNAKAVYAVAKKKSITLTIYKLDGITVVGSYTTPADKQIEVFPSPVVSATVSKSPTCKGDNITLTPKITSSTNITNWLWDFGDGSGFGTSQIVTHSYESQGTYYATVFATDENGCTSTKTFSTPAKIIINADRPIADFTVDKTKTCDQTLTTNLTNISTFAQGKITGYQWDFSDGTIDTKENTTKTFTRTSNKDVKAIYLTAFGDNGCNSIPKEIDVTLYKLDPQISISDNVKTLSGKVGEAACGGGVTIATLQESETSYIWDLNGSTSTTNNINQTLSSGSQTVYLTATNPACSVPTKKTFTVEAIPDFSITPLGSFHCAKEWTSAITPIMANVAIDNINWFMNGETIPFSTSTGTQSSATYTFTHNNSYDIKANVTTVNGCKGSKSFPKNIQVYFPEIKMSDDKFQGCIPLTVNFENKSTYDVPNNTDFINYVRWDFGDGSAVIENQNSVSHTYVDDGDYKAILHIETKSGSSECKIDGLASIFAGRPPVIKFSYPYTTVCGTISTDDELKSGLKLTFESYVINKDGSISDSKYDSTETQIVGYTNSTWSTDIYRHSSTNGNKNVFKFNTNKANEAGIYKVKMTEFYNGCPTIFEKDSLIKVNGPLIDAVSVQSDCSTPYLKNLKETKISDAIHWDWIAYKSMADKSLKKLVTYNSKSKDTIIDLKPFNQGTGEYSSTLIAYNETNKCIDSSNAPYYVTNTIADVSLNDTTPCVGTIKQLTIGKMKDIEYIVDFSWNVKDPSGQIDSIQDNHPNVSHRHKGTSLNLYKDYVYPDPSNNNTLTKESISFDKRGEYTINMTVTDVNTCKSTKAFTVRAYQPIAGYKMSDITSCLPVTLTFTDTTKSFSPIVSREWTTNGELLGSKTGNDLTASDTYSQIKTYPTSLKVTDSKGCTDIAIKNNGVSPLVPVAKIISEKKVCVGTAANFSIDKTLGAPYVNTVDYFVWDFGDGTPTVQTTDFSITHVYNEEITNPKVKVTSYLTTSSNEVCVNNDLSTVLDIKDTKAQFDILKIDSTSFCNAITIQAKANISDKFNAINWNEFYKNVMVSKGDLKIDQSSFTMVGPGDHFLKLTVTSDYRGCTVDESTKKYTINQSLFKVVSDKNIVCVNDTITFSLKDTVNVSRYKFKWNFSDGTENSTSYEVKHYYESVNNGGNVNVKFIVDNKCKDMDSIKIQLRKVGANFDRGTKDAFIKGCVPFTVPFINTSIGQNISYVWNFGDNTTSETTKDPTHTFTKPGETIFVTLQIQGDDNGIVCKDDEVKKIITYPNPHLDNNITKPLCEGSEFTLQLTPGIGTVVDSIKANTTIESISSNNLTLKVKPLKTTSYIIYDHYTNIGDSPCPLQDTILLKVQNQPGYNGAPKNYLVYLPNDTLKTKSKSQIYAYVNYSLNNDSIYGISYKWEPSTGLSCTNCANPTLNVDKDVEYTLTMTDTLGCFKIVEKVALKIIPETEIGLPSAFTPNTDGSNDIVIPRGWGIKEFLEIDIFNRWGQLVYKSNDLTKGWDGTFNGRPQDPDTYAWLIKYKDTKDLVQEKKGYITLLR